MCVAAPVPGPITLCRCDEPVALPATNEVALAVALVLEKEASALVTFPLKAPTLKLWRDCDKVGVACAEVGVLDFGDGVEVGMGSKDGLEEARVMRLWKLSALPGADEGPTVRLKTKKRACTLDMYFDTLSGRTQDYLLDMDGVKDSEDNMSELLYRRVSIPTSYCNNTFRDSLHLLKTSGSSLSQTQIMHFFGHIHIAIAIVGRPHRLR
jgi:hypothetical protein